MNINYRGIDMEFGLDFFNYLQLKFSALTIEDWKNLSNILFFISATLVAWLSYIAAKKSLLSPMKNEILKYQFDEIKEVLQFFRGNPLSHWKDDFDVAGIINLNIKRLITMYFDAVFSHKNSANEKVDESFIIKNNKLKAEFKGERVCDIAAGEYTEKYLELRIDLLTDAKYWDDDYVVCVVALTKKFNERLEHLKSLISSPLLPSDLINLLEGYEEKTSCLYISIADGLNEAKKTLNFKNNTAFEITPYELRQLQQFVHNSADSSGLAIQSEKIVDYVRSYLNVNKIMR